MCSFDEFAGRFFISFRYTLFMMEIKPEIVDRVLTHTNTVISTKFNKYNNQVYRRVFVGLNSGDSRFNIYKIGT